ncbi:hypothetical protein TNCV_3021371 [Trichonephila clavipes]|nr:hypothetical protein TNCV_3021371 [Trichonephila clavipes]
MKLIKIGVDQDISWSTDEVIRWISRDILDRRVVMPIYFTKEVYCEFLYRLSDGQDITCCSNVSVSHVPMGIENLS